MTALFDLFGNAFWLLPVFATVLIAASVSATLFAVTFVRHRRARAEQHRQLFGAIANMNQGLCMFDAQGRLVVWNERYREMYGIAPDRISVGCSVPDLLSARIAAGTFPLDPAKYDGELREALKSGKAFVKNVELADGRCVAVVNQPIEGGGWVATHEDVTERVQAEQELARTRAFLDAVISNVPTPVIVKSLPDMRYLLINKEAERFLGLKAEEVIGKTAHQIMDAAMADRVHAQDKALLEAGRELVSEEHVAITPNGQAHVMTSRRLPVMGSDGKPQYLIIVLHDLTDRRRNEERISYLARHDPITDLPNRASFNECLNGMFELAGKSSESFALLCMDVDRFKAINDTFGSASGDKILKQLGARLQEACEGAFVARIGGDEFCVVSPTGPQPATADALAAKLRDAVAADFEIDRQPVSVGLTIGIAIYPTDASDAAGLLANAEAALFRAKLERRGTVRYFEPEMDQQLREKRALQHDLRQALQNEELELYYQPQADMDGTITGFEALARWHHPRHGMVPPGTFIPLAEESGLIIPLGEWILRAACKEAASWPKPLRIAVNLSPVQFQHGDLPNLIHETLLACGLSPGRLEIEITEGVLIGDFSRAVAALRRIKNLGVRIAMDDFGTGYSSLSYLQSFPFDKIKIDQVFIANLLSSPQSAAIVRAVIGLGQGLGLPVIAEGVETREQRELLTAAACDGMQGYLIGRPQPIAHYAQVVGRPVRSVVRLAVSN